MSYDLKCGDLQCAHRSEPSKCSHTSKLPSVAISHEGLSFQSARPCDGKRQVAYEHLGLVPPAMTSFVVENTGDCPVTLFFYVRGCQTPITKELGGALNSPVFFRDQIMLTIRNLQRIEFQCPIGENPSGCNPSIRNLQFTDPAPLTLGKKHHKSKSKHKSKHHKSHH